MEKTSVLAKLKQGDETSFTFVYDHYWRKVYRFSEIYLNDGETVFSTRYYPDREDLQLKILGGKFRGNIWNLRKMIFTK